MENIMEIQNLAKHYKDFSLKNISLNLPKGSIMGFIGENGAGKSTTIKLILNIISRDSGKVKIFGQNTQYANIDMRLDMSRCFSALSIFFC